jgi:hypothetical protein
MSKKSILLIVLLAGCATPQTLLENKSHDVVSCGGGTAGSLAGGLIGYNIQKDHDNECIQSYIAKGYIPVKIDGKRVSEVK